MGNLGNSYARPSFGGRRGRGRPLALADKGAAVIPSGCMPAEGAVQGFQREFGVSDTTLLPSQVGRADWRPEQDMLSEMVLYAVKDAFLETVVGIPLEKAKKRFETQRAALGWIFSTGMQPFQFEWVCQHVNIDPEKVRKLIRASSPKAKTIEEHLRDPENVPAPEIPERFLVKKPIGRRSHTKTVPA